MWNLRKKKDEHLGREERKKKEWEVSHKRLLIIGNKLRVAEGEVGGEMG